MPVRIGYVTFIAGNGFSVIIWGYQPLVIKQYHYYVTYVSCDIHVCTVTKS